jgi:GNAT superfamily N-acetyltransferase
VIEDLLFKRRVVFAADAPEYEPRSTEHDTYCVTTVDESTTRHDHELLEFLTSHTAPYAVGERLARADCTLYLARHRRTADPVGFYWSVAPRTERVWHDSFPVDPGESLVFDAFVDPDHRRNGIYGLLQAAAHNHLFDDRDRETVYTIVEKRNSPSLHANREFGLEPARRNYLVKFLGFNVLSVLKDQYDTRTHVVADKPTL